MSLAQTYHDTVQQQLHRIRETQAAAVNQAGEWWAESLINGGWIFAFGSGHSHMMAEELFYRAGGLARIVPMLSEPLMLHQGAIDSSRHERDLSLVPGLLQRYPVGAKDVLLVASNSGRNALPIELALRARERGARVIAMVNRQQCGQWPSRHPGGKNLDLVADLVLDNCGVTGDACVQVDAWQMAIGPTSTIAGALLLQMVMCAAVDNALARGVKLEVLVSNNTTGDESNRALLEKYRGQVPHL